MTEVTKLSDVISQEVLDMVHQRSAEETARLYDEYIKIMTEATKELFEREERVKNG